MEQIYLSSPAVIKTIRMPKTLADALEKIAYTENKKFNTIVNEELARFCNYTYKIRKISSGEIIISSRFFKAILDLLIEEYETLKEKGYELGKNWGKEYLILWNTRENKLDINVNSFIDLIVTTSMYSSMYKVDVTHKGNEYIVIFHHNFNRKFSAFISGYYEGILDNIQSVTRISTDINENSVIITFKVNEKGTKIRTLETTVMGEK